MTRKRDGISIYNGRNPQRPWLYHIYFNHIPFDGEVIIHKFKDRIEITRPTLDDRNTHKITPKSKESGSIVYSIGRDEEWNPGFIPFDVDESDEDIKIAYFEDTESLHKLQA